MGLCTAIHVPVSADPHKEPLDVFLLGKNLPSGIRIVRLVADVASHGTVISWYWYIRFLRGLWSGCTWCPDSYTVFDPVSRMFDMNQRPVGSLVATLASPEWFDMYNLVSFRLAEFEGVGRIVT